MSLSARIIESFKAPSFKEFTDGLFIVRWVFSKGVVCANVDIENVGHVAMIMPTDSHEQAVERLNAGMTNLLRGYSVELDSVIEKLSVVHQANKSLLP
jgi:hypothetical protein